MYFTKVHGAGNDFILFDFIKEPPVIINEEIVRKICHRHFGIGADGIMIMTKADNSDFNLKYYNSDGSTGDLCANGSRCAIKYAYLNSYSSRNVTFTFEKSLYKGEVNDDNTVTFYLNPPKKLKYNFKINAAAQLINAGYADVGSPHIVININDVLQRASSPDSAYKILDGFPVETLGKILRNSKEFYPKGVNVNFIDVKTDTIHLRTFEKGVEAETLSCGTGAVSTAIISYVTNKLKPPIKIFTRSGDNLFVNFGIENKKVRDLSLRGPAELVFRGEINF